MIFLRWSNSTGVRNSLGVKTRNFGGKAKQKRKYRFIDFKRSCKNQVGVIKRIDRDSFRSAFVALVLFNNGVISYMIATQNLQIGSLIYNYDIVLADTSINFPIFSSGKKDEEKTTNFLDNLEISCVVLNIL